MNAISSDARLDLLIAGASFAGLTLALALARAFSGELAIALVDPAAPPDRSGGSDSRASNVSLSSRRLLETLGMWPGLAPEAEPMVRIEITDSALDAGIRPVFLTYENRIDGEPGSYILPNSALRAALYDAAARAPGVTIYRAEARGLLLAGGLVRIELGDKAPLTASLLAIADGRRSRLRDAAGIKTVAWGGEQTGIVVTVAHERPHNGTAVQHFLPAGPFAILPLKGNRSCVTWSEERTEAQRILNLDDAVFLTELDRRFGGRLGALALDGPRQSWPLETHLARRYVGERVAVIGDAAHGVHPIAGQGLNLALRDAAALAEAVTDALRLGLDPGDGEPLRRYERWRRFDASLSTFAFDGLNRLFSSDGTLTRAVRSMGLGVVDRLPALKSLFVAEGAGVTGDLPKLLRGLPL